MSKSRVVLSQELVPSLEVTPPPFQRSKRWCSKFERENGRVWPTVFVTQRAYQKVNEHADSTLDLEVGGMLVGQVCLSTDLTFTSNTLANLLNRLEEEYPDKQIVGWYHTHPGLSVFLSSMDVWLHTHFFPESWHVALVVDPYISHGGFFCYADGGADYLNPKNYVGFYEMLAPGTKSVVSWYNLEPCVAPEAQESRERDVIIKDGLP